jgi:hypothetical protein
MSGISYRKASFSKGVLAKPMGVCFFHEDAEKDKPSLFVREGGAEKNLPFQWRGEWGWGSLDSATSRRMTPKAMTFSPDYAPPSFCAKRSVIAEST